MKRGLKRSGSQPARRAKHSRLKNGPDEEGIETLLDIVVHPRRACLKNGPDEEGIETLSSAGVIKLVPHGLKNGPDEEGIETVSKSLRTQGSSPGLKNGPDEEGIETFSIENWYYSLGCMSEEWPR